MLKLSDFAHCDDDTEKRPVVRPRCEGFDIEIPCTARGEVEFVYPDGRRRQFCRLHHYTETIWEGKPCLMN